MVLAAVTLSWPRAGDFIHHAIAKHLFDPAVDASAELASVAKNENAVRLRRSLLPLRTLLRSRRFRLCINLQCPNDPPLVPAIDLFRT